jgi:ABC-2 type transport system ATP-binding protein
LENAIETQSLSKTYAGGVLALDGVSLEVPRGCCFGLLGPNGAGKSTLVKCLLSIVHASAGSAMLRGVNIRSPRSRQHVGYLPEGHRFPKYLTAAGVCEYFGGLSGMGGAALKKDVAAKLELVGLSDWADTKVSKFSKGMAQRVGVAQSLIGDPELIFLDEPTDGVDPMAREGLRSVITDATTRGATVFINSHLLQEIEILCDQVGILNHGKLVEQGSVSEITAAMAGDRLQVRVRTDTIPAALWSTLEERGATKEPDGYFLIELDEETDIPALIDQLRAESVGVFAIEPRRLRLEEAFVAMIRAADPQGSSDGAAIGMKVERS